MIDLHTHSTHSDGTLTPEELIRLAEDIGLSAVALCDHNTVSGLPEFLAAAKNSPVEAVPGIEFSTDYNDTELHIIALWIRPEQYPAVTALLQEVLVRKEASNLALIAALNRAGLALDYEKIKTGTPGGIVNRAIIGAELTRLGYTPSVQAAFSQWLSPRRGYYTPPRNPDAFETIRFIRSLGAVSVLAHPFLNLDEPQLRVFLKEAAAAGLDGMETRYSKFDETASRKAKELADTFGLLESGGSDFHGENKPDIRLGSGKGNLLIPEAFLTALKDRLAQHSAR